MPALTEGKRAPKFTLQDFRGHSHPGAMGDAKYLVVYFYPKDDTPGCTIEAKEFSAKYSTFKRKQAHVYGISGGDARSKEKFCGKFDLAVPLLSDSDFAVAKKFGAFGKKSFMGRTYEGVLRKTFVLDTHFRVLKVFDTVKPEGHAEEVLQVIEELESADVAHQPVRANPETRRDSPRAKRKKAERSMRSAQKSRAKAARR